MNERTELALMIAGLAACWCRSVPSERFRRASRSHLSMSVVLLGVAASVRGRA